MDNNNNPIIYTYEERLQQINKRYPGAIIKVAPGNIRNGRLYQYGKPANGNYIFVVKEDGSLVISGTRLGTYGDLPGIPIDAASKLPHPTLSNGEPVIAAGEIVFENGRIKSINSFSGHYYPERGGINSFNCQTIREFKNAESRLGLEEVAGGADVNINYPDLNPVTNPSEPVPVPGNP